MTQLDAPSKIMLITHSGSIDRVRDAGVGLPMKDNLRWREQNILIMKRYTFTAADGKRIECDGEI